MTTADPPTISPYQDPAQRTAAQQLGLWTFLATEILFFGGLFATYAIYRTTYPAVFAEGSRHLDFWIGTLNTAVLLTSSLGVALADNAAKAGQRVWLRGCLVAAGLLGAAFLGLKFYEYHEKFVEHLVPGAHFAPAGGAAPPLQLFFLLYFTMTGLHAVHMLAGLALLAWLVVRTRRRDVAAAMVGPLEMTGLYWHFVDCVWVFLYPLLYLIR